MKKKALQRWIATVILVSTCLSLIGCGGKKTAEVESETIARESADTENLGYGPWYDTEAGENLTFDKNQDYPGKSDLEDEQLALIQETIPNILGVYETPTAGTTPVFYITDLDQDGLKEIIINDREGDQKDYAYEVNPTKDDLVDISNDSCTDGFTNLVWNANNSQFFQGFYDETTGQYIYGMYKENYNGDELEGITYYLVHLGRSGLIAEELARLDCNTHTCTLQDGTVCLGWVDMWEKIEETISPYKTVYYSVQSESTSSTDSYEKQLQESNESWAWALEGEEATDADGNINLAQIAFFSNWVPYGYVQEEYDDPAEISQYVVPQEAGVISQEEEEADEQLKDYIRNNIELDYWVRRKSDIDEFLQTYIGKTSDELGIYMTPTLSTDKGEYYIDEAGDTDHVYLCELISGTKEDDIYTLKYDLGGIPTIFAEVKVQDLGDGKYVILSNHFIEE